MIAVTLVSSESGITSHTDTWIDGQTDGGTDGLRMECPIIEAAASRSSLLLKKDVSTHPVELLLRQQPPDENVKTKREVLHVLPESSSSDNHSNTFEYFHFSGAGAATNVSFPLDFYFCLCKCDTL